MAADQPPFSMANVETYVARYRASGHIPPPIDWVMVENLCDHVGDCGHEPPELQMETIQPIKRITDWTDIVVFGFLIGIMTSFAGWMFVDYFGL